MKLAGWAKQSSKSYEIISYLSAIATRKIIIPPIFLFTFVFSSSLTLAQAVAPEEKTLPVSFLAGVADGHCVSSMGQDCLFAGLLPKLPVPG